MGVSREVPFFEAGLPGEILHSRVSRYHVLRGNRTCRQTYLELFNCAPFPLTHWLPENLHELANILPGNPGENLLEIQRTGTLLPLFQQFGAGRTQRDVGRGRSKRSNYTMPRRMVGESGTTHLCPACLIEDAASFGVPYLHLAHQIPGVTACWRHAIRLLDRCPTCRCPLERTSTLVLSPWLGCECGTDIATAGHASPVVAAAAEMDYARFSRELLEVAPVAIDTDQLVAMYRARISTLGFGRGRLLVNRVELLSAIEEYFGTALLADLDPAYRRGKTSGWFHPLSCSAAAEAPLTRHLIFSLFLFRTADCFVAHAKAAANAAVPARGRRLRASDDGGLMCKQDGTVGDFGKERAISSLVRVARQHELSVDDLWLRHFGAMKQLVKRWPLAPTEIAKRLAGGNAGTRSSGSRPHPADREWAEAIQEAAARIYRSNDKPRRMSTSILIRETHCRPATWPTAEKFPATYAACEESKESQWHYYARRVLWAMRRCTSNTIPRSILTLSTRLEYFRAGAVYDYLRASGVPLGREATPTQLLRLGITRDWKGPCPDQVFPAVGRAYQKIGRRKGSRRG